MTGIKNNEFKINQVIEGLLDVKCWAFFLIQLTCSIPNGGVSNVRRQTKQKKAERLTKRDSSALSSLRALASAR